MGATVGLGFVDAALDVVVGAALGCDAPEEAPAAPQPAKASTVITAAPGLPKRRKKDPREIGPLKFAPFALGPAMVPAADESGMREQAPPHGLLTSALQTRLHEARAQS